MPVAFDSLRIGAEYTRPELAERWGYASYEAISRGVVTPAKTPFIIFFITEDKQEFLTQYEDRLEDDVLYIEGEEGHRSDQRLVNSTVTQDEIHLFHRKRHHAPFVYHGRIFLASYQLSSGDKPSRFVFSIGETMAHATSAIETEQRTHGIPDLLFVPDEEGRKKIVQHVSYERSRKNRARALEIHGTVCTVCGFDFNAFYGKDLASDYIEVHHVDSITAQEGKRINPHVDPHSTLFKLP